MHVTEDRHEWLDHDRHGARGERLRLDNVAGRLPGPLLEAGRILHQTIDEFLEDGAPRLAAALAYYILIAMAPLLLLAVTLASALFERREVRDAILGAAWRFLGDEGAVVVDQMLIGIMGARASGGITALGIAVALFGASAAFWHLQAAINIAWGIRPRPEGIREFLRRRLLTFVLMLAIGVLLLVFLVFGTGFSDAIGALLPTFRGMTWLTERAISIFGVAVLFAVVFKILPDRRVDWRDTAVGALFTAVLFNVGSAALGLYLAHSSVGSLYGAAGSFAVLLVWLYYSTQVFLFGAEFTHVWVTRRVERHPERSGRAQESSGEA